MGPSKSEAEIIEDCILLDIGKINSECQLEIFNINRAGEGGGCALGGAGSILALGCENLDLGLDSEAPGLYFNHLPKLVNGQFENFEGFEYDDYNMCDDGYLRIRNVIENLIVNQTPTIPDSHTTPMDSDGHPISELGNPSSANTQSEGGIMYQSWLRKRINCEYTSKSIAELAKTEFALYMKPTNFEIIMNQFMLTNKTAPVPATDSEMSEEAKPDKKNSALFLKTIKMYLLGFFKLRNEMLDC